MGDITVRGETPDDHQAIWQLNRSAFPTAAEADLIGRLRAGGASAISLVAERDGAVIGHILFSEMRSPARTLGLAPVAVDEKHRKQGIAAALIRAGISLADQEGWRAIFVLGDPAFYQRFGFRADAALAFESAYAGPHFMVRIFDAAIPPGRAEYAAAFDDLE